MVVRKHDELLQEGKSVYQLPRLTRLIGAEQSEHLVPSTDQHNTTTEVNTAVHGFGGPVQMSLGGVSAEVDSKFLASSEQFSNEFPFNLDMNSGKPLGLGKWFTP